MSGGTVARTLDGIGFETKLRIELLQDPIVDTFGYDARSDYVERFWLPILGPTTTFLLRHLVGQLERTPSGCTLDIGDAARALGLGERPGRHGPFLRSVTRAVDFDMARVVSPGAVAVRRLVPVLSPRHVARLPRPLQREHLDATHRVGPPLEALRRRGQQLALSLLELGEGIDETKRQLAMWKFHPALAHQCALWATREIAARSDNQSQEISLNHGETRESQVIDAGSLFGVIPGDLGLINRR